MLKIKKLEVGQLRTNCYLIIDPNSNEALIIDPGDDADYIQRIIADEEVRPQVIIATHGHFDHIMAVTELKLAFNIPFLMHKNDEFLLSRAQSSANYFAGATGVFAVKVDKFLTGTNPVSLGKTTVKIIETPGHTPGSLCLYSKKDNVIFVGDLIFAGGGVGRCDFAYSDHSALNKSIKKIFKLPKNTIIYSGHGMDTTIGQEKHFHS